MVIDGPVQGQGAILRFLLNRPAATPDDVREKLEQLALPETTISPVANCLEAVELIYARRHDLPVELVSLGADLAEMAARLRFAMGPGVTGEAGRAIGISTVLRAIDGVASEGDVPTGTPPEAKKEYLPSQGSGSSGTS